MSKRERKRVNRRTKPATSPVSKTSARPVLWGWWSLALTLIGVMVVGWVVIHFTSSKSPLPGVIGENLEIPNPDTSDMLPPVAHAIRNAHQALFHSPTSAEAWGNLGMVFDAHHLYEQAVISYRRAHELAPSDFRWSYFLGIVQELQGADLDEVASWFQKTIKLDPTYPEAYFRYGDVLARTGKLTESRDAYLRAIKLRPNLALAHVSLGQVLLSLGNLEQAEQHLERAARLEPEDRTVFSSLARVYLRLGDRRRADQAAKKSRKLTEVLALPDPVRFPVEEVLPVDPDSCLRRAQEHLSEGRYSQAISDLRLFEESLPDDPLGKFLLGIYYLKTGKPELAITHWSRAIQLKDDLIDAHLHLASLLQKTGRLREAIHHYRRVLFHESNHAEAHGKLGLALGVSGDLNGAIREFKQAAALSPSDPGILHNLGTALMRGRNPAKAAEQFRLALKLNPKSPDTLFNLGNSLEMLGRVEEAITHYRQAVKIDPSHIAARRLSELED